MSKYIGAVDLGTTSNRFMILDARGGIVGMDQKEHEQIFPRPGWVEHDPMEIWNNTRDVIRGALAKSLEGNGGAYFVSAFSGLFAPYWRTDARGMIVGLTRFVNKGHIARAVLEANAYQTLDVMEAMRKVD